MLTVRGMESIFRIVETNDFKQLPHITLTFRPGNDAAIKQVRPPISYSPSTQSFVHRPAEHAYPTLRPYSSE